MAALTAPRSAQALMQQLEQKVTILISKNLIAQLEISQLQQENAHLMAQLRAQNLSTTTLVHP